MRRVCRLAATLLTAASVIPCGSEQPQQLVELHHFAVNDLSGIISRTNVDIDTVTSSDGGGSLRIEASEPATVRLYEVDNLAVEDARLIYRARLRTQDVEGYVYLEMWCLFLEGEFFSRDLESPLTGTMEWTTEETPFFLQEGQTPDGVKLNLVIEGTGTVWIDDIRLLKGPLSP